MSKYLNIPIAMVLIQFLLQWQKLDSANIIYLALITSAVLTFKLKKIKLHFLVRHLILITFIVIQFVFEKNTITKDFFVNCLYILFLFKLLETRNKNYFFFLSLSIFLTVANLINNQNLISSFLSAANTILIIVLLYLINQRELIHINFGNLKRLIMVIFVAVPSIIITYLFFPRAEINVSLFNNKTNNLGIPETISLGTFEKITQSDQSVFNATFEEQVDQNQLYFRVKTFSILNLQKNWKSLETKIIFKDNKQDVLREISTLKYSIIVDAHDKKWVPVLDYVLPTKNSYYNNHNFTYQLDRKIVKKRRFNFTSQMNSPYENLNKQARRYYLQLPNTINSSLRDWANTNKKTKTDLSYLNFVMNHFKENEYFYSLNPKPIGNNYAKFFFESKEGYCEYYAGTMTILARAAGIPSRIVTGFYGGQYNQYGNFFTFAQEDAHSWVEAWVQGKGWVRFDPTQVIPPSRIKSNINNFKNNGAKQERIKNNTFKIFGNNSIELWARYLDYQWGNYLISYDSVERNKFINNLIELNKNTLSKLFSNILLSIFFIFFLLIVLLLFRKKDYSNFLFFIVTKKFKLNGKKFETHQHIFEKLNQNQHLQLIIKKYEEAKFLKSNINFLEFVLLSIQILLLQKKI